MSDIYYGMIVFPLIFSIVLLFIFSETTEAILVEQTKLNCPMPINSGVATLGTTQNFPDVNYTIAYDDDNDDYHVTIFECVEDTVIGVPQVNTVVYTATTTNSWFDVAGLASGYMFYISQSITAFFQKAVALGTLIYLTVTAPAQVTGLAFFSYIQLGLFSLIAIGGFMVIRGN